MSEPVQFYNRYTDQLETEAIYGEGFLRFSYATSLENIRKGLDRLERFLKKKK